MDLLFRRLVFYFMDMATSDSLAARFEYPVSSPWGFIQRLFHTATREYEDSRTFESVWNIYAF